MPDILSCLRSFRHLIHLPDGDGKLLQRFRLQRDELAFATLVQRHGPMVLGIAQRILGQSEMLDDVFQATFLVLAKRGRQMETWPSVAGWLVQVARRTALQARAKSARRTRHEQQAAAMTLTSNTAEPADVVGRRDLAQQLDAELARLPSKYRTPLVLCHLEGQTKEETARQLGWPVGSVSGRLARGKKLLQARLLRRGIVPALATGIFTMPAANAHLPSLLIQATTLLATNVVHQTSHVSASTAVVLAQGVMTSMLMTKVKYAAAVLLMLGLCLGTGAWAWQGKGNETAAPVQVPKNEAKQPSLLEQIQGEWFDGRGYWVFRNNEVAIKDKLRMNPDFKNHDLFQINESTRPAKILFAGVRGVIKISEGKLYLNLAKSPDVTDIPEDFLESPTRNTIILHRVTDYDRLEGIWRKEERNPVTDEITFAEELIFRKNMYVRREYRNGIAPTESGPYVYSLNESTTPKQLDLEIRDAEKYMQSFAEFYKNPGSTDRDSYIRNNIDGDKDLERRLAIYELKDNEFKYVITGAIPFKFENGQLVLNTQSPLNKRASSFATADGTVFTYKRVQRSLKDSTNTKPETPDDPRIKPPTGTRGETPTTEPPVASPQLQDLRQQRLKVALERMGLLLQQETKYSEALKQQQIKPLPMSDTHLQSKSVIARQVLDARLALTQDKAAQVQAMEEHLKLLKQIEDGYEKLIEYTKANRDNLPKSVTANANDDLLAAKLRRIEFSIQLEELKEKR